MTQLLNSNKANLKNNKNVSTGSLNSLPSPPSQKNIQLQIGKTSSKNAVIHTSDVKMTESNIQSSYQTRRRGSIDYSEINRKRPHPDYEEDDEEEEKNNSASKKIRLQHQHNHNDNDNDNDNNIELNIEPETQSLNDQNILKKSMKIRREYFCNNYPTLVITPVNGHLLKSQTAIVRLFGRNIKGLANKLKAHTFSSTRKTIYVHFTNQVQYDELHGLETKFNEQQLSKVSNAKDDNNNNDNEEQRKQLRLPKCFIFSKNYVQEQKVKRNEEVNNPEINRDVILKNVSLRETEDEIMETLHEMNLNIAKVERFKGLPIVKVTFSTSEDVKRILQEKEIIIGYNVVECHLFDKFRSRPRSHFIQCRKCFGLNHMAKDCPKKKICKYCGMYNHTTDQCYKKGHPGKYKCALCKGKHPSDSILCPVIQKVRTSIGINFSRREKQIIDKKERQKETRVKDQERRNDDNTKQSSNVIRILQRPHAKESYRNIVVPQSPKQNGQIEQQENRKNSIQQQQQKSFPRNNQLIKEQKGVNIQPNEIAQLKQEITELRSTIQSLASIIQELYPLIQMKRSQIASQETNSMEFDQ